MVLRKKTMLAYLSLSHLFHQILRFCVQDQNGGKRAKNRSCIKTQFWLSLAKHWVQEGKQMKGDYPSLILSMKHWFWQLETVSTALLVGPVVRWENYDGEAWMPPNSHWSGSGSSFYHARWTASRASHLHRVSCFYFYSGFLLRSRFIFLWTKDTPWKTDELLCADLTCPCSERSRAIERYTWLYQPHISFTINCTSQPLCFLLQLKIHPHVSRTLGDWPMKAIEKGPRCQLRSEEKQQGEARTWISFTEVNRIPAKCAVACGCCWRWGHFVKTLSWS